MMKFTLLVTTLSSFVCAADAQPRWGRQAFQQLRKEVIARQRADLARPLRIARGLSVLSAEQSPVKPLKEEEYAYTGHGWELQGSYSYTYDRQGNILTNLNQSPEIVVRQVTVYDSHNQDVETIEYQGASEAKLKEISKQTKQYDSRLTDFVVDRASYEWKADKWVLVSDGNTWKRQVKRNEAGQVVGLHVTTLYNGEYRNHHQTVVTYNDRTLADTWAYSEVNEKDVLELWYTLEDMEWQTTDGQIVSADLHGFFTGNNKLKSARVVEPSWGETGRITATYADNGDYSYTFYYHVMEGSTEPYGREVLEWKQIDDKGSYELIESYYADTDGNGEAADNELQERTRVLLTCDEYGNEVLEEMTDETGQVIAGTQYERTYQNGCAYPSEVVYHAYNPDIRKYEPFMKIVSSDFVDVTTGIDGVQAPVRSLPEAVYNLSGIRCNAKWEALPAGIYVVKQGGNFRKVVKE